VKSLPEQLISKAFIATNGEPAWRRQDIDEAVAAICDAGKAILGGEVWLITGPGTWEGLIPQRENAKPAVWHWETAPRSKDETWQRYCDRTASQTLQTIRNINIEQQTPAQIADRLRFNLTFVEETGGK
jgi:hypothetical protein